MSNLNRWPSCARGATAKDTIGTAPDDARSAGLDTTVSPPTVAADCGGQEEASSRNDSAGDASRVLMGPWLARSSGAGGGGRTGGRQAAGGASLLIVGKSLGHRSESARRVYARRD